MWHTSCHPQIERITSYPKLGRADNFHPVHSLSAVGHRAQLPTHPCRSKKCPTPNAEECELWWTCPANHLKHDLLKSDMSQSLGHAWHFLNMGPHHKQRQNQSIYSGSSMSRACAPAILCLVLELHPFPGHRMSGSEGQTPAWDFQSASWLLFDLATCLSDSTKTVEASWNPVHIPWNSRNLWFRGLTAISTCLVSIFSTSYLKAARPTVNQRDANADLGHVPPAKVVKIQVGTGGTP